MISNFSTQSITAKTPAPIDGPGIFKKNPFNTIDRSPLRPRVRNLREMENKDRKRFEIYRHYSGLHEFTPEDVAEDTTLEQR